MKKELIHLAGIQNQNWLKYNSYKQNPFDQASKSVTSLGNSYISVEKCFSIAAMYLAST